VRVFAVVTRLRLADPDAFARWAPFGRGPPCPPRAGGGTGERREGRGDELGDLRREGHDIGRFAFYAAPTRIELDPALAERLAGRVDL